MNATAIFGGIIRPRHDRGCRSTCLDEPGLDPLRNLVVLNSLSKRSGAAGLRAGFMVGDNNVIGQYLKLVG